MQKEEKERQAGLGNSHHEITDYHAQKLHQANTRGQKFKLPIIMERLNYNPLSLKDVAFRRMAVVLWMEPNILASLTKFHYTSQYYVSEIPELWRETVGDKIVDNISKLGLPMSLTKQLIDTVKEMAL
ncbi:unnamed protein product [Larinioides sclopetarius]|uniref:Uncharacterized protein n=1 Tax=Larinioides sclopetarius TaxID=280406 RepID=A0AAV2BBV8_9ARAC